MPKKKLEKNWNMESFLVELKGLLQHLQGTTITGLEWEGDGWGIRILRKKEALHFVKSPVSLEEKKEETLPETSVGIKVVSPVVGVFHFPSTKPQKGDLVREGKELGYVEAIQVKHFLEIEKPGKILEIHVEEGQPVGFGDLLFTLSDVS
jgi:biotin carboxyl carrier protein